MKTFPRSVWIVAVVLALVTLLPYAVGTWNAPEGGQYSGAPAIPGGMQVDFNSHLAKLWQGSRGEFAYQLLFTHEDHPAIPTAQAFYVVLGMIGSPFTDNQALVYHTARFVLTLGLVLALWAFVSRFFQKTSERWLALCFGLFATGWGWLLYLVAPGMTQTVAPIEFWLIDAYNLMGAFYMPHFSAAIILQIVAVLLLDAWMQQRGNAMVQIGLLSLVLLLDAIIQPYVVLLTFSLIGLVSLYYLWRVPTFNLRRALWLIVPLALHGGIVIYQFLAFSGDPIWASFTAQNITASPPPIYYVMGYLPFLLPLLFGGGAIRAALEEDPAWIIPVLWVLIVVVLLYVPIPTQRRYLLGVQTPLAVLTTLAFSRVWLARLRPRQRPLLSISYLALASIAMMLIIFSNLAAAANPTEDSPIFYSADEVSGYQWLRENTDPDALILTIFNAAGQGNGGDIVATTGRRVFMGHWIETANFDAKIQQIQQFYDAETDDAWRRDFLDEIDARYVWYDHFARELGDWSPADAPYLEAVFSSDTVQIYRVDS